MTDYNELTDVEIYETEEDVFLYQIWKAESSEEIQVNIVGTLEEAPGRGYRKGHIKPKFYEDGEPMHYMWNPTVSGRHEGEETSWIYETPREALEPEEVEASEVEKILESAFKDEPLE